MLATLKNLLHFYATVTPPSFINISKQNQTTAMQHVVQFKVYFTRKSIEKLLKNPNFSQFYVACEFADEKHRKGTYPVKFIMNGYNGSDFTEGEEICCPRPCDSE